MLVAPNIFLKKSIFILFLSQFLVLKIIGQNKTIDSLLAILKTNKQDTTYINNLNLISNSYNSIQKFDNAKQYALLAKNVANSLNYNKGVVAANFNFARAYYLSANYDSALIILKQILEIGDTLKNKLLLARVYRATAEQYLAKSDYTQTLSNAIKALKLYELLDKKQELSSAYRIISIVYLQQKNYKKVLEISLKNLEFNQLQGNEDGMASAYSTIGIAYLQMGKKKEALTYTLKSKNSFEKAKNNRSLVRVLNTLGSIFNDEKNYLEALKYYKQSNTISIQIKDKIIESYSSLNIAKVYENLNKLGECEYYLNNGFKLAKEIGNKELIVSSYEQFPDLFAKKGDYKKALFYQKLYTSMKDTLYNTESSKQITEMNTKYETEKKDKELIKKDAEINMRQVQAEKQAVIKNGFIIGFVFLLGLIIYVYRGYVQKQKTNKLLKEKNQKITDSINYAKIIQSSILPSTDELKKYLPQSFIFYQPKDIVSGDFYWLYPINENIVVFAVVDCTGHGVPGALMSMLGYSLLEQIINQNKINKPAEILDQLNDLVKDSLKQSGNEDTVKNGMDMVIFKLDYSTYELEFAGAKNPLYIIRDQNLIELKGDRKSIGLSTGNANPYINQQQQLQAGDHLYAFSDGYIDQKGGTENKKFYSANFQKLLISINSLNASEQQEQVKTAFTNWKGKKEQMDDVLVFGVKV